VVDGRDFTLDGYRGHEKGFPTHGMEGVRFCTRQKAITTRWPTGMKAGGDFTIPTMR